MVVLKLSVRPQILLHSCTTSNSRGHCACA